MIWAIVAILAIAGGFGLWLWRKGKKEAYGEVNEKAVKVAQAANDISKRVDGLSSDDLERLRTEINERD